MTAAISRFSSFKSLANRISLAGLSIRQASDACVRFAVTATFQRVQRLSSCLVVVQTICAQYAPYSNNVFLPSVSSYSSTAPFQYPLYLKLRKRILLRQHEVSNFVGNIAFDITLVNQVCNDALYFINLHLLSAQEQ